MPRSPENTFQKYYVQKIIEQNVIARAPGEQFMVPSEAPFR
jgi:hypothetical protein